MSEDVCASAENSRLRLWLLLLRAPNILTVPGDPLAGFLLARMAAGPAAPDPWRAGAAMLGVIFIYMHGLIANDLFDRREDRRERPHRPLASGRLGLKPALAAGLALAAAGLALAGLNGRIGFLTALALVGMALLYNGFAKRFRIAGPLCMGLCRALGLLTGAAAAGLPGITAAPAVAAAAALGLYVAAVTCVAQDETREILPGVRRWLPVVTIAAGFSALGWAAAATGRGPGWFALAAGAPAAAWAVATGVRMGSRPAPAMVPVAIGRWLRGLLWIQFGFAAISGVGWWAPAAFAAGLSLLHSRLSRIFYCS